MDIIFGEEARDAINTRRPVVALESTVIAHGLPYPQNIETALAVENIVREAGAVPATIAVLKRKFCVGLSEEQIEFLARGTDIRKISRRDLPVAAARGLDCATTVATTSFIAHRAGLRVFATGGIGGVHRGFSSDISADLPELAQTPITVVCSGAKVVLDLPATREWLETFGVTVLGWQCDEMPAFYSGSSGLAVDQRIETAAEAADIAAARDDLGLKAAILVTVRVPAADEIPREELEAILAEALAAADREKIGGKAITPFLLSRISEKSEGRTLASNISLLKNNAKIASEIAIAMSRVA